MKLNITAGIVLLIAINSSPGRADEESILEEIVVTAEFRQVTALDLAASVSVFDQQDIDRRGAVHLEQLLALAPNVNISSGASRGRFVQIRGIGERLNNR